MRPNPRWQQQGGRGQGEPVDHDGAHVCDYIEHYAHTHIVFICSFITSRGFPSNAQLAASARAPCQPQTHES